MDKSRDEIIKKIREGTYSIERSLIQIDSSVAKVRYQEKQNKILDYLLGLQETQAANLIEGYIDLAQNKFSFIQAVADYHLALSELSLSIGDPYYFKPEKT